MFAEAFRDALERRGMTLATLRERLRSHGNPISLMTLSYWRSGARHPEGAVSLAVVTDIEDILGLESGTLMRRLRPSRRLGAVDQRHSVGEERIAAMIEETWAQLVPDPAPDLRDVSTHIVADVDEAGYLRTVRNQAVLQCVSGVLTEVPYFEVAAAPTDVIPEFRAISACRIGRGLLHPGGEVFGVMLELDRPVEPAGTAVVEWEATFPPGYPFARFVEHAVDRRSREVLMIVRFHPAAPPTWCEEFEDGPEGETVLSRLLDVSPAVHVVRNGFGPGRVGISWGYDE